MYTEILTAFLISAVLTLFFKCIIQKSGSCLLTIMSGGTPRAVGIGRFMRM